LATDSKAEKFENDVFFEELSDFRVFELGKVKTVDWGLYVKNIRNWRSSEDTTRKVNFFLW
jgi:hypothetical protein